mgnify:FL=1
MSEDWEVVVFFNNSPGLKYRLLCHDFFTDKPQFGHSRLFNPPGNNRHLLYPWACVALQMFHKPSTTPLEQVLALVDNHADALKAAYSLGGVTAVETLWQNLLDNRNP